MIDLPLKSLYVSDFRRLDGHHTFPLDAPVVLIHGANGTGKTSVLSALEFALTGNIRSMSRHDERYTAHLPFHGQEFATLRVEVAEYLAPRRAAGPMTVGGDRIDGIPALTRDTARFYAERCYLDQTSLSRLLEIYQAHERNQESALVRFVNELLGLEQLDALGAGLFDTGDVRRMRTLSPAFDRAESEATIAASKLVEVTELLASARDDAESARVELLESLRPFGLTLTDTGDSDAEFRDLALSMTAITSANSVATAATGRALLALGGRIQALSSRPTVQRLEEARSALALASGAYERWRGEYEPDVLRLREAVARLGLDDRDGIEEAIDAEAARLDESLEHQDDVVARARQIGAELAERRERRRAIEEQLLAAQETAGSLAEGLAALREHAVDNVCPVCDRAFSEVSAVHLTAHMDQKLAAITSLGAELSALREHRDAVAAEIEQDETLMAGANRQIWSEETRHAAASRRLGLAELRAQFLGLRAAIEAGAELERAESTARAALEDFESVAREAEIARAELRSIATDIGAESLEPEEPLTAAWERVNSAAAAQIALNAERDRATAALAEVRAASGKVTELTAAVARVASERSQWEGRVREASRRRALAKKLYDASATARAAITERVFTQSLNGVWRDVFTRLAPRESFIPVFETPSRNRNAVSLSIGTVHTSGEAGGAPQMMLSAGNLNTAALSLFVALHLAVAPMIPCLVFDDPVQSMDEVHVAQFAALIRMLAKKHDRQVIIAVHERELFQYLCLELSPAFEGDELITIELGAAQGEEDRGVVRHSWSPDASIAV